MAGMRRSRPPSSRKACRTCYGKGYRYWILLATGLIAIAVCMPREIMELYIIPGDKEPSIFDLQPSLARPSTTGTGLITPRLDEAALAFKFPSAAERVQYYMGSWYDNRSCHDNLCEQYDFYRTGDEELNNAFVYDRGGLSRVRRLLHYSQPAIRDIFDKGPHDMRMLMMFGDTSYYPNYPLVLKSRNASRATSTEAIVPILMLLNERRHYERIEWVKKEGDVPWKQKRNSLIWRGIATGFAKRFQFVKKYIDFPRQDVDIAFSATNRTDMEHYVRSSIDVRDLLHYKYLLSMEGNDVASGLKWMLYSDSVVMMPVPTVTSWAMEGKLVPWVHFIPLKGDASDLVEMLWWARDNDELCHKISQQATQFMDDLYATKEAKDVNHLILQQIVDRYHNFYGPKLEQCTYPDPHPGFQPLSVSD